MPISPASTPPVAFDAAIYRSLHVDLSHLSDDALARHYDTHGRSEGRRAHALADRTQFAALAADCKSLEIGPFAAPLLQGPHVRYADIYSTAELRRMSVTAGLDPERVPNIDWVVGPNDLGAIDDTFDAVLTSHVIEHQPNLVGHLRQVHRLLRPGGRYFLAVPDHRYCFDHFKAPSTIVDILDAHVRNVALHDPRSLIRSRFQVTHNDPVRHWAGDHGAADHNPHFPSADRTQLLRDALSMLESHSGGLYDDHAWFFTPDGFASIIDDLSRLELIPFALERLYPTLHNTLEFWAILRAN